MRMHRKVSPEDIIEEPKMDDANLSRLGTKAMLNQQGKTSYKYGVQQSLSPRSTHHEGSHRYQRSWH